MGEQAGSGGRTTGFAAKLWSSVSYYVPSTLAIVALILIWHFSVTLFEIKEYILPSPGAAVATFFDPKYRWGYNFLVTFYEIAGAFAISTVLGIALAVLIVWNSFLERTILPLLVLFNTLPKIALAPLFVIWLGYGIWPNIVIAVTVSFFPVVVNTAAGLSNVDEDLLDLVRSLKARKWQIFLKIRFPNAMPYIFTALELNATLSVVGAVVGEFVASEAGLGALIIVGGVTLSTPSIFAALILISALGLLLYWAVVAVGRFLMPWERRGNAKS
ncbi:ABC transporter permease [Oceanibacterium hippocampi]|uniref:Putative aliphatic sulfonates transport permease protein SsuC n=1 Tax=Oceanibacterium hippocampi TaxID=745714 RepID=A0A1Y5RZ45_9PROT|nr:ABC transporter permease [Oceanibacterium hippocampi]SLN27825.1 Putative aliphatic sulfonates transport permease protein SsuC [Oceanibacterium hippocampi]